MKKYINSTLIATALVLISLGSCVDLTEEPEGILSPDSFFNNEADFAAATIGIYSNLYGGWNDLTFKWYPLLLGGGEDVSTKPTSPSQKDFDAFRATGTSQASQKLWIAYYQAISNANILISKIDNLDGVITKEKANGYEGQARYLRAFSYFHLVRSFGEVPIVTIENQQEADKVGQSPVADIYQYIISDLKIAKDILPVSFNQRGKATKGAATALLSRVYITMAGWPLEDASNYALARDNAAELISGSLAGTYRLERDFADLWLVANKLTNKEMIFAFYGTSSTGQGSKLHHAVRPGVEGGWSDVISEARFFNAFPDEYRKDVSFHSVFLDGTEWQDGEFSQPFIAKFRDGGIPCGPNDGGCGSASGDFLTPISRYADVLLTFAEAANMAEGGPSAAALEAINQVRRRANNLDPDTPDASVDLPGGMSQGAFDDAVIAERNWELAFENNRWYDLVRKKMVVEVNKGLYPHVTENNRLFPKPSSEVDLIEGLEQNEGY